MEELARAPRLGAALTTNGEQSEEELLPGGETVRQTVAGRQRGGVFSSPDCSATAGAFVWITKF